MLVLTDHGRLSAVPSSSRLFKNYITRHFVHWLEFVTETLQLDCRPEDLILVRGTIKTLPCAWAVGAYLEEGSSLHEISVRVTAEGLATLGFDVTREHKAGQKFDYRVGFDGRAGKVEASSPEPKLPLIALADELPEVILERASASGATVEGRRNQCLFVQYFKAKPRTFFPLTKIVAGAGYSQHSHDGGSNSSRHSSSVTDADTDAYEIETEFRDSVSRLRRSHTQLLMNLP